MDVAIPPLWKFAPLPLMLPPPRQLVAEKKDEIGGGLNLTQRWLHDCRGCNDGDDVGVGNISGLVLVLVLALVFEGTYVIQDIKNRIRVTYRIAFQMWRMGYLLLLLMLLLLLLAALA